MSNTRKKKASESASDSEKGSKKAKKSKTTPPSAARSKDEKTASETKKLNHEYSAGDFDFLNENEHVRYLKNSSKVGHAVITKDKEGEEVAFQYAIPQGDKGPTVRPLKDIQMIERYGMKRFRAVTPDHATPMYATRFIDGEYGNGDSVEKFQIACFSPEPKPGKEPFWGGGAEPPLFRTDLTKSQKKELDKELKEIKPKFKAGKELVIEPESVKERDLIKVRKPDQNTVMGESAKDAYEAFMDSMMEELHPEMKDRLKRAVDAELRDAFKSNYRPEWLHAEGFGLTPMSKDPQRKDNLGAAPKWANTEMMVLERIAKWFAMNRPSAFVKIKPFFEMLLDSELIKKINFEVTIQEKDRFVKMLQEIQPFKKFHLFRKASDIAQGTAITYSLLQATPPVSQQKLKTSTAGAFKPLSAFASDASAASASASVSAGSAAGAGSGSGFSAGAAGASSGFGFSAGAGAGAGSGSGSSSAQVAQILEMKSDMFSSKRKKKSKKFPTYMKYEKSVVQVLTTSQQANYDEPWSGTSVGSSSGTGLVISHEGRKYILTNAHVVQDSVFLRVRLANDRKKKYEAKRKCVSYQCDLALLEVDHPEFNSLAKPVELGDMVGLQDKVIDVGFPMGGSEISITKGIVSRIEVRDYCMSGLDMLQVQVDAAINPGNSGGPVFSDDKVVGVAFQGYNRHGLGYIIPIPIIKHFLQEAFSNKPYRGFPILPMTVQTLENPALRRSYSMAEEQTGVRIKRIDNLCDAYSKLKPDDILIEIDSLSVSNEGTVDIPGVGNCIDFCHVTHMKFIGDKVNVKVLRKNAETQKSEVLSIDVTLDRVPLETEKVPQTEYDKMPTYFISSGISFIPLTRNYIEGKGSELEEFFLVEDGCTLIDAPKKREDEQVIILNDVLDCEATEGYDSYVNAVIKEINGKPINNIHDVIKAMETNENKTHVITTASKSKVVVPNMSKAENAALLKRYNIKSDRSDDLLDARVRMSLGAGSGFGNESKGGAGFGGGFSNESRGGAGSSSSFGNESKGGTGFGSSFGNESKAGAASGSGSRFKSREDDDSPVFNESKSSSGRSGKEAKEVDDEIDSDEVLKREFTGVKNYRKAIDNLEERVKAGEFGDDSDELDEDFEEESESDSEMSVSAEEAEESEAEQEVAKKQEKAKPRLVKLADQGMFKPAGSKRKDREDDHEYDQRQAKKRRVS